MKIIACLSLIFSFSAEIPQEIKKNIDSAIAAKDEQALIKALDDAAISHPQQYESIANYWLERADEYKKSKTAPIPEEVITVKQIEEAPAPAQPIETKKMASSNINDIIAIALEKNPKLQEAKKSLEATEELESQAIAEFLPEISASLDYGRQRNTSVGDSISSDIDNKSLNIVQPIWNGGKSVSNYDRSLLLIDNAKEAFRQAKQEIIFGAASAYINLISDWKLYNLAVDNEKFLDEYYQITDERFNLGELSNTDLAQAKTRLSLAQARKINAKNQYVASKANYEKIVGVAADTESLDDKFLFPELPTTVEDAIAFAIKSNPQLKQVENRRSIAEEQVDASYAEFMPDFSIRASSSREENSGITGNPYDSDKVMLNVSVPIFSGGESYSKLEQAKTSVISNEYAVTDTKNEIIKNIKSSWSSLESSGTSIDASRNAYESSIIVLDGVKDEEGLGLRTILDVLDAEQERIDSLSNLINSERSDAINKYTLLNLIGKTE